MKPLSQAGAFTLLSVACLTIMVGCVIVPGLPIIAENLGVSGAASWLVTLPSLGVVLFGHAAGKLIDRHGAYRSLCLGLALYGAIGVVGSLLHGPLLVFADRLLLGGATALVMAAGTGLISEFYEGRARLEMIARQGMAIELGGVIFLFIGGLLAVRGWQLPFALYLMGWLFLAMVLVFIPNPIGHREAIEDTDPTATPRKLLDVYAAASLSMIAFFTGVIVLPSRLHGMGLDEAQIGYFLSYVSLVAVGAAFLMPPLVRSTSESATLIFGFLAYSAAHCVFAFTTTFEALLAGGALMGAGFGFTVPLVNHTTVERSHPRQRGRNLAQLSIAIFLGQFLSSFMEFIPGDSAAIFAAAAVVALLVAALMASMRLIRKGALA
jgi:MFS family permease